MMLHCIYSNDVRLLNRFLVNTLQDQALDDPFLAEQIVVPGIGLSQWLKLELAKELGVAVQIDYPMPANFLWRLFHNVLETVPKESDFNKEVLHWHIYAVLPALLEKPEFQAHKHYLEQGHQQGSALHAFQLAAKIADVFDQYLVYRIDWINDWSAGGSLGADQHAWQPILWRAVCERIKELGRVPLHRAGLFVDFIEALKKPTIKSSVFTQIPPRLFFFGFSALPPIYLAVLEQLAKHRDIYLLVLNPCRYFWSETDYSTRSSVNEAGQQAAVDHALLASFGKQARGFLSQLQQLEMQEKEFYLAPSGSALLSTVQKDLLEGKDRSADSIKAQNSQHKIAVNKNDFSLSFHSHYSPLREVEALHNHLLYLFESDSTLTAGDVVVMVPAIDRYSPYIHAVFNYEKKIPFSVADRSAANEEPLLKFLLSLLQLPSSRLTASEVQEWLALPAVQRRFQLDENDCLLLGRWIQQSGIRWALHAEHRREMNLPAFEENTWYFGLKRMLAGYSMGEQQVFEGIASFDEVGGLSAALVGKLAALIEQLEHSRAQLANDHTVDGWITLVHKVLDDFFVLDADDTFFQQILLQSLENLSKTSQLADYSLPLPPSVFLAVIKKALTEPSNPSFLTGQLSFCSLLPKRALPFKVVCLLGMNEADYPTQPLPLGFDLMAQNYRSGDRSRRDEERYLFLEALSAADETLYVSWIGRNNQDNTEKPASVLVSELLAYCQTNYCLSGDEALSPEQSGKNLLDFLLTQHPLHAFSPENFIFNPEKPLIFSYAGQWLIDNTLPSEPAVFNSDDSDSFIDDDEEKTTVSLDDFLRFFKNPCAYFMRRYLQADLSIESQMYDDHEPFVVDALQAYQLKQQILTHSVLNRDGPTFDRYLLATGQLPASHAGQFILDDARAELAPLIKVLATFNKNQPVQKQEIDLVFSSTRLQGWIKRDYAKRHVTVRVNEAKAKDYLEAWLYHLLLCASDAPEFEETLLLTLNKKVMTQTFKKIEKQQALAHVSDLLAIYINGRQRPLPFFPKSAWEFYSNLEKEGEERAFTKACQTFYGNSFDKSRNEASDANVSRVFPLIEDVKHDFIRLAKTIYAPLCTQMAEEAN